MLSTFNLKTLFKLSILVKILSPSLFLRVFNDSIVFNYFIYARQVSMYYARHIHELILLSLQYTTNKGVVKKLYCSLFDIIVS